MEELEIKEQSITEKIVEDFILSLNGIEGFNEKMIHDLQVLAAQNHLSSENAVEEIVKSVK